MTFSIDVLPAPLGPMMARISPLRMSKDTSRSAFTPPNDSDTFSTDSSTSPAAAAPCRRRPVLARRRPSFGGLPQRLGARARDRSSCRRSRRRPRSTPLRPSSNVTSVATWHSLGAVVERRDQRRVALGDERAAHLLRAGQLAVVGIELLVQDQEAPDLRGRHLRLVGQRRLTSSTRLATIS